MGLAVLFLSAMMLCSCDLAVGDSPAQTLDVMVATLTSVPLQRAQLLSL